MHENQRKTNSEIKILFFGTSRVSKIVLEELRTAGFKPELAPENLNVDELKKSEADVFIVASYGKILPKEILDIPKFGSINVHPSLLPKLRGPAPIQNIILQQEVPGITIIKMDEKMDHGPILAQEKIEIDPFPDHYILVEAKLAHEGGRILAEALPAWIAGEIEARPQDDTQATYTKKIKTSEGLINLNDDAERNLLKVYAYSTEPGAYIEFLAKSGKEIRVKILDAEIHDGKFIPTKVVPAGKKEMSWESFLRGNA